jgi:hypothetical protein
MQRARNLTSHSGTSILRRLASAAAVIVIGVGMAGVAADTASAANANLAPGQSANFPTWLFGRTTICVHNLSSTQSGTARFAAFGSPAQDFGVQATQTVCVTRQWFGYNVNVKNVSSSWGPILNVYNVGGP